MLILCLLVCSSVKVFGSLSDLTFTEDYNTNDLPPAAEGEKIQVWKFWAQRWSAIDNTIMFFKSFYAIIVKAYYSDFWNVG